MRVHTFGSTRLFKSSGQHPSKSSPVSICKTGLPEVRHSGRNKQEPFHADFPSVVHLSSQSQKSMTKCFECRTLNLKELQTHWVITLMTYP